MRYKNPVRTAQNYRKLVALLIDHGLMQGGKASVPAREISQFSKNADVQDLTQTFIRDLHRLWENRHVRNESRGSQPAGVSSMAEAAPMPIKPGAVPQESPSPPMPNPKITFTLPNAKMNEPYSAELRIQGETDSKKVLLKEIICPPGLGLSAAPGSRSVQGVPLTDGEHKLAIFYQFEDAPPGKPRLEAALAFYVNPDPKALWKNLPSDRNDPDFKPDEATQSTEGNQGRTLLAASRRGRSHAHVGSFRDDDFRIASAQGWDILAVADGAGSAKVSRKGSEIAVQTAVDYLREALVNGQDAKIEAAVLQWHTDRSASQHPVKAELYDALGRAAYAAVKAIEHEAAQQGRSARDYATTLILAAHKKIPCGHLFAAYWVGDGGVGVYRQGNRVELLGEADSGEYAGQTRFLDKQVMTPDEVMKRLRFTLTDDFTALVLMSDGVTDPKFETDNNLAGIEKWDALWAELQPVLADKAGAEGRLLDWLAFWSAGNHDDRTIALLY